MRTVTGLRQVTARGLRALRLGAISAGFSLLALGTALANGPPQTIVVQVAGGDEQDQQHAMYKPGSTLPLHALVLDATGRPADLSHSPCTPVFDISNNFTPGGKARGTLVGPHGDHVLFGDGLGPFTVNAHCAENPKINSEQGQQPYNFQTDNGPLARSAGEDYMQQLAAANAGNEAASVAPSGGDDSAESASGGHALLIAGIVAASVVGVVAVAAAAAAGGGSSSSTCSSGSHQCAPPNSNICCPDGTTIYCTNNNTCTNQTSNNFGNICGNGNANADGC